MFTNYPNLDKFVNAQQLSSPKRKKLTNDPPIIPISTDSTQKSVIDDFFILPTLSSNSVHPTEVTVPSLNYAQVLNSSTSDLNNLNNVQIKHNPLRAIPPKKTIFVSRLASETTIEDIEFYIKSKMDQNIEFSTYKFNYSQPRTITSFKITVPLDIFDTIVDPGFWPVSTLVREYQYKEHQRNAVHLPSRNPNAPKN